MLTMNRSLHGKERKASVLVIRMGKAISSLMKTSLILSSTSLRRSAGSVQQRMRSALRASKHLCSTLTSRVSGRTRSFGATSILSKSILLAPVETSLSIWPVERLNHLSVHMPRYLPKHAYRQRSARSQPKYLLKNEWAHPHDPHKPHSVSQRLSLQGMPILTLPCSPARQEIVHGSSTAEPCNTPHSKLSG